MDAPPPRRRFRRVLLVAAAGLVLLLVVGWFAPTLAAKAGLVQMGLDAGLADLQGRATFDGASLGWLSPVTLRGVTVTDPAGATVLRAERVTTSKTLLQLARDRADLGTVTVTNPVVTLRCRPGGTNVEDLISKLIAGDGSPPKATRPAVKVEVVGGKLVQTEADSPGETVLEPLDLTAVVPADPAEPVTLVVKNADALSADLRLGSLIGGKLHASDFPLEAVAPVVRRFRPGVRAAGRLTADLSGTAGPAASVHGQARVNGLSLAGVGPDPVRLGFAELPLDVAVHGAELEVRKAELTCDVGKVTLVGRAPLDGSAEEYAGVAGLTATAEVDVAKLAAVAPRLLRLRPGTTITEGKLAAKLASLAAPAGTRWSGELNTSAVKGTRDGRELHWDQPVAAAFVGHMGTDGVPEFDKLAAQCEFAAVAAAGRPKKFQVAANLDLDKLMVRLGEFADLSAVKLRGRATVQASGETGSGGRFAVAGTAELTDFAADAAGLSVSEPAATLSVRGSGVKPAGRPLRLDVAEADVLAAGDKLTAKLVEPTADARTATMAATVSGDVARWRRRLAAVVTLPADWELGGAGTVAARVALSPAGVTASGVDLNLQPARFRGAGVDLDEPTLTGTAAAVTWEQATNAVRLTDARLSCPTVTLDTKAAEVYPVQVGTVNVAGPLDRLTAPLKLGTPLAGTVRGPVTVDTGRGTFTADLRAENVVYGSPVKPVWHEPWVNLKADGDYRADALRFRSARVERDGATADAAGSITALSATPVADVSGTLDYDLARLEPQLREFLGPKATVRGGGHKPFRLKGPLGGSLDQLDGEAAVGWQAVKAHGFDMGPADLKATLAGGKVGLSPVRAGFGGGVITVTPAVDLTAPGTPLSFAPGTLVDHAKLSPEAMAGALGYALPAAANAARADGTVSFELGANRVPLADPAGADVVGNLVLHDAHLTAGPGFAEVLKLLDAGTTAVTLAKDQKVPVAVKNGRVFHDNFALTFGQTVVTSRGSVGLADQSLQMELDLPIPPRAVEGPLRNNPQVLAALKKQRIKVPMTGTLGQPRLDEKAYRDGVARALKGFGGDLAGGAVEGFLKKGLGDLEKKLLPKGP